MHRIESAGTRRDARARDTGMLARAQFHGARRLAEQRDRFWWAGFLLAALACALAALASATWRFHSNPTFLVRTSSKRASPPFPCVMICPELAYPAHKVAALVRGLTLPRDTNETWLRDNMHTLAALHSPDVAYAPGDLEALERILSYNHFNVEEVARNLTSSCEEILLRCRWRRRMVKCNQLFSMELTTYGFCCVFNGRSLQREMNKVAVKERHEAKHMAGGGGVGLANALVVAVDQSQALDDVDRTYKWVTIQLSQQYVECSYNGTPVARATEQWVGFGTELVQTAQAARQLRYSLRKCRFSHEPLHYFPVYTKAYCNMECTMRRAMQRCKCVPMTLPRPAGVARCRARTLRCARTAAVSLGSDDCDCPMSCDQERDFTLIQNYEFSNDTLPFDSFYKDLNLQKISIIRVYIPTYNLNTFSRRSVFDSISLFSQMGGVFGVFFGCSILTLLELTQLACRALLRQRLEERNKVAFADIKNEAKRNRNGNKM